jgi:hypothetical protein
MPNQSLLTYASKVSQVQLLLTAPSNPSVGQFYTVLARTDPWPDDNNPPAPTQDQKSLKLLSKNIFAAKLVQVNDFAPIIPRFDWKTGTIYSSYTDTVSMFSYDAYGVMNNVFYIKNRYDQVFKCLWNNNGGTSTNEPYFQPGAFSQYGVYTGVNDGYKWKYMYTVDTGQKIKFMDSVWIPVYDAIGTLPNQYTKVNGYVSGAGSIDVINVTNGGSGYDSSGLIPVTVTVTGDGIAPVASAVINGSGVITDIVVTTPGTNYTVANVSITSAQGSGATAVSPISPTGGHGIDPISELGCNHAMIVTEFNGSEGGLIPTDIKYYQVAIMNSPYSSYTQTVANGSIYSVTTNLQVSTGVGSFQNDEFVYQGTSLAAASFVGTVLSFDSANNVVKTINTTGAPVNNQLLYGVTSGSNRMLLSTPTPNEFTPLSGYFIYIENRSGIQRSSDGIEQFKVVLGY